MRSHLISQPPSVQLSVRLRRARLAGERDMLSIDTLGKAGDYWIDSLPPSQRLVEGIRLRAVGLFDGAPEYDVFVTSAGTHYCGCPHFQKQVGPKGSPCKHIQAAYQAGLLTLYPPPGLAVKDNGPSAESLAKECGSAVQGAK